MAGRGPGTAITPQNWGSGGRQPCCWRAAPGDGADMVSRKETPNLLMAGAVVGAMGTFLSCPSVRTARGGGCASVPPSVAVLLLFMVSWTHGVVRVGRDLERLSSPTPLPWAGTSPTRPGCSSVRSFSLLLGSWIYRRKPQQSIFARGGVAMGSSKNPPWVWWQHGGPVTPSWSQARGWSHPHLGWGVRVGQEPSLSILCPSQAEGPLLPLQQPPVLQEANPDPAAARGETLWSPNPARCPHGQE